MWLRAVWACALWVVPAWALGAPTPATVTILDGNAIVIREASKFTVSEGAQLVKDDIIETGSTGRLVRLEFADGVILDLGPESSVLLWPKFGGERGRLPLKAYLRQGWIKVTMPKGGIAADAGAVASPAIDLAGVTRRVVVSGQAGEAFVFAESGEATLMDRRNPKARILLSLKPDDFMSLIGSEPPLLASRPVAAFMQRIPRPFLDTIPSRAQRFKGGEDTLSPAGNIVYSDVQSWIDAEPSLRSQFVTRWKSQAQLPEFRKRLVAGLRLHPEWDRTLYPEKYLPKLANRNISGFPASTTAPNASSR